MTEKAYREKTAETKYRKKKSLVYLLMIPAQILIDLIAIAIANGIDLSIADRSGETLGHAAPAVTIVVICLASLVTIAVTAVSIGLTVKGAVKRHNEKKTELSS